ncbi:zinc finger MYM-type protein 5-like [Parasteatoda tepidariorum]|uniref:zinc finger MYM-type protein 5-like n=1 Tax=Parasteatoda tepidariorum TaxID=114398 RepID=UPI001C7284C6|nr:uncharacterized protein LOC122270079 [Parasteatoda tepidariorum]
MERSYMSGSQKRKHKKARELQAKKAKWSILKFFPARIEESEISPASQMQPLPNLQDVGDIKPHEREELECASVDEMPQNNKQEVPINDPAADYEVHQEQECFTANVLSPEKDIQRKVPIDDPAKWHTITDDMIDHFLRKPPPQNMDLVKNTVKIFNGGKRLLTKINFFKIKKNGEKLAREWLVLSASEKKLFCWVCKLFGNTTTSLSTSGFDDWKHVVFRLTEHENSFMHWESILRFTQRLKTEKRIDSAIIKQYQSEVHYWHSVLQRIVETVKFLSSRGMAFFGENEMFGSTHNGNFLGCLELIAHFDPFLVKHIEKAGNQGIGNVNYLSSTIVNEFVELMGEKVLNVVITEVIDAKYFLIIVDSTPDVTHMDQLTLILRYLGPDYKPVERFINFIQIFGHNAESLTNVILQVLED